MPDDNDSDDNDVEMADEVEESRENGENGSDQKKRKRSKKDQERSRHKSRESHGGDDELSHKVEKYKKLYLLKKKEADEMEKANSKLKQELKRRDEQRLEEVSKANKVREEATKTKKEIAEKNKTIQEKSREIACLQGKLDTLGRHQLVSKKSAEKSQQEGHENLISELKDVKAECTRLREMYDTVRKLNEDYEEEKALKNDPQRVSKDLMEELRPKTSDRGDIDLDSD